MRKNKIVAFVISKTIVKYKNWIVLKIGFSNGELIPWAKKITTLHVTKRKWGIRIYCPAGIFTVFTNTEGKGNYRIKNTFKFF